MSNHTDSESRALKLLGTGVEPEIVARTIGISVSRISQLVSEPDFAEKLSVLRYENLAKHTERDERYDKMEDALLERLEESIPYTLGKPLVIARLLATVNQAKRRGSSSPAALEKPNETVQLNMPTVVMNQFITNINKQVVKVGNQELVTVQSGNMAKLLEASNANTLGVLENEAALVERIP